MLETKDIEIGDMKFQLNPLKGFKAVKLDKKVISLCLPALKGVKDMDEQSIDIGMIISGITDALDGMTEGDFEKFVLDLLSTTILQITGKPPMVIDSNTIDSEFQGESITLYKLLFEVMKYNKFTPFVLASGGGSGTLKTLTSSLMP